MFWRMAGLSTASPVESLLDRDGFTLEELLDEDELIQECKSLNTRLINFLRGKAQIEQLVKYIIEEPPEGADNKRAFRFPYFACEILTCEIEVIMRTLVEDEELMGLLFSFLEPDRPHGTLLAGYFSKVVVCLLRQKMDSVKKYLQVHHGIFKKLVDLIDITSIMEVLIRLVVVDDIDHSFHESRLQWLVETDLLEMLVDKLSSPNSFEARANAADTLSAVCRLTHSELATKLSSPSFIERLFHHTLDDDDSRSTLVHSLTVCISLLDPKRYAMAVPNRGQYIPESFPTASPETINHMLQRLGGLLKLLSVDGDERILPTTYGELRPPLGSHRLKIVEFLAVLLHTSSEEAQQALVKLGAIQRVLDLFFDYPFNNLLHHHVEDIVTSCIESNNKMLIEHLLVDCHLVERLLEADENPFAVSIDNKPTVSASGKASPRIGSLGHLTRIANKLAQAANNNSDILDHLQGNPKWVEWQSDVLQKRNFIENVCQWTCGRPTTVRDRPVDSDDDDYKDKDLDTAMISNGRDAFRYGMFENDDADEDVFFDDESGDAVMSSLRLGDEHDRSKDSFLSGSNWFAFPDDRQNQSLGSFLVSNPMQRFEDGQGSSISSSNSSSSDDEVVVGEDEDPLDTATSSAIVHTPAGSDDCPRAMSGEDGVALECEGASSTDDLSLGFEKLEVANNPPLLPEYQHEASSSVRPLDWESLKEPSTLEGPSGRMVFSDTNPFRDDLDEFEAWKTDPATGNECNHNEMGADDATAPNPFSPHQGMEDATCSEHQIDSGTGNVSESIFGDGTHFVGVEKEGTAKSDYMWNSAIQCLVEDGRPQQALDLYQRMRLTSATPNKYTLLALLKSCTKLRNREMGQRLWIEMSVNGLDNDSYAESAMVHMYMKCGAIKNAEEFFNKRSTQDTVSWNALLTGYVEHGLFHEGMHLLEKMQSENIYSDSVTHICSLKICNSLGLREKGQEVHMEIVKSGLETDCFTNNALVDMYSKFGSFDETWKLVENLQLQNTVAWTSIITGCADHGCNELALLHLREMQLAGFSPDGMTFASSLKACGRIKDIDTGTDIHDEIFKKGFDDDPFLGNVLVDMYIKCNLLVEAEIVFHSLPIKDLISWNTLINGCIEGGINGKALKYLEQMPAYGICPDNITFMCILRLCASMSDIERGKKIHSEIIMKGFETEEFVHSNLVDMYAKCGMLSEAIKVCRRFSSSYVVAWNSLIAEYIERGYVDDALECLEDIKQSGIDFDAVTFASSLRIFKIIGSVTSIYCLHSEIIKSGLDTDPLIGNIIIDSYVKCGSCIEAEKSFEKLVHRDVTSWNAIMSVYIHSRSEEKLSGCLEQMSFEGISPDCVTFTLLLKESSISGFTERGHKLHSLIIKSGFDEDLVIQTTLVGLYGNHGSLEESQTVFDRIGLRDVVAWTALITGYANLHMWDEVLNCFEIIKVEGISPDANTWAYLIQAYGCMGEIKEGQKIHAEIVRRGLEEESNIHNNLISMYRKFELHLDSSAYVASPSTETGFSFGSILTDIVIEELGVLQVLGDCLQVNSTLFPNVKQHFFFSDIGIWELHTEVLKRGLDTYCSFSHGLMHIYVQCCRLEEVEIIFDTLMYKDIISWNSLIKACIECGSSDRALQYFQNMQVESMTPDANTYLLRSEACQDVGDLNLARQLHSEIIMKGLEKDSFLSSNLLDMYGKNGRFLDAQKVFDGLKSPDVVSWTAVIAAYVNSGLSEDGLRLLEKMLQQGICPNVITYGVITKLYGIRKSTNGCLLLHAEITKKGFDSDTFLCNSLVDMYIKCGLLMEIQDFIKQLPYRDVILFTTLIVGYYEHGKYEEVFNTFKRMQSDRVRPNHVTYSYTLNACAKAAEILLGKAIHVEVIKYGFEGDHVVGDSLILMYASSGLYDEALYVLHNLPAQDTVSWNMLIECYVDHGFFNEAVDFFHLMLQQGIPADQILWNTIIMAYIDLGESENAFIKYSEMLQQGVLPDDLIFVALSKACGNIASIEVGRRLHAQFWVESESQSPRGNFAHALIDMYGKCGSILESQRIFHSRPMEDAIAWNFALASYIRQGDCVSALYIYSRMQEKHIDLNESVLLNLLTLCSHGGLVYRGQLLFENFCTIMKILPSVEYFTCIIDLLARAGQLEEASAIIDFLPSSPDHVPYNCLLSAWQRSNDVELGG